MILECNIEKNKQRCTCTYEPCEKKEDVANVFHNIGR